MRKVEKWETSCFGWHNLTGVYCVFTVEDNKKSVLQYIGSSKNIGKRLSNPSHPYRILVNQNKIVYVKYKVTKNYISSEKKLIIKLNPPLNIIHNGSK